jgi:F-type H+-transporting ATPase subunit b
MKRFWFAIGGAWALFPWPALAEEGKRSLPQLDVHFFPGQLFWLAITFPLLFLIMRFVAVPNVRSAQGERQKVLRTELNAAEADSEKARRMQDDYEKSLTEAHAKAVANLNVVMQAMAAQEAERRAAQQKELNSKIAEAEKRITAFRDGALKEARAASADLAGAIVEKLLGEAGARR